jgi:hypothetical protein
MRVCRLRAMQSQKAMKEIVWRAKRLTREMQAYWKRYDRVEKVCTTSEYFQINIEILLLKNYRFNVAKQKRKQKNSANSMWS